MMRVCYVFPVSHHYRRPFHERLRILLAEHDIEYDVFYCEPKSDNLLKRDTVDIPWGRKVALSRLPGGIEYQHAFLAVQHYDLIIMQQENKLALNYVLMFFSLFSRYRLAYFGHGRNFQSRNPHGLGERLKRIMATKVHWWFAYTDETRRHIKSLGFSASRISVFNNSVDTSELRDQAAAVTPGRLSELRAELCLAGNHVGIFVGGIYADKRMPFLVEAADHIRTLIPDFEIIVVGGGPDLPVIENLAKTRPWIRVTGPRFGTEKVELMMLGRVFLMPGLMGLAILDAGIAGLPIVTTAFPWHSPEIAYLQSGHNGLMVGDWENPVAFGDAVSGLLANPALRIMGEASRDTADKLSIENMAESFAKGVLAALAA